MKKDDEFLKIARDRYKEGLSAAGDNRDTFDEDTQFENGDHTNDGQWTDDELKERANRPCLTENRLSGAVKQITGDALVNRPSGKVRPVDSVADPIIAEILTGLIRNIENNSDAEDAYDTGHGNSVRGNIGYWRIKTVYSEDDSFDQDIEIERIVNSKSVVYDQSAIKKTYEDAEYCFVATSMRKEKFQKEYPKASTTSWEGPGDMSDWFAEDTVNVAEYWYKEPYIKHIFMLRDGKVIEIENPVMKTVQGEGMQPVDVVQDGKEGVEIEYLKHREVPCHKVMMAVISGAEVLEEPVEWAGKYIPIIPCLGDEVWVDGKRVLRSAIRFAITPQKLHNWNVSNAMETKALAPKQPWILSKDQIKGYENLWNKAYATPMPYLLYNFVPGQPNPQRLTGSLPDVGAEQGQLMSIDAIKAATGVYDAALGAKSNETSGIAIEKRQRQTSTSTFVFIDNQNKAIKYTWKQLIDLVPKIYDSDRIVRLLGNDLKKKFAEQAVVNGKPLVQVAQDGLSALARINFKDPITGKLYNDLSMGKYDTVVDSGPGYMTRRQEANDAMMELAVKIPDILPVVLPRIAKNGDWPDSDTIGDEIKAIFQPRPQEPSPKDQIDIAKGQQALAKGQADLQGKQLDNATKVMELQANGDVNERLGQLEETLVEVLRRLGAV